VKPALLAIGTALPEHTIAQADAATAAQSLCADAGHARLLPALYRRSSVSRRGSVLLEGPNGPIPPRQSFFPPAEGPLDRGPTTRERLQRYEQAAAPLAITSATAALSTVSWDPARITHLVTVSCTGFAAPGVDAAMIKALGLSPAIARTNIGFMGCHGAINALRVAEAFARADADARVLLTAVELCSLHFQYGPNPQQAVANALFADGAASAVIGAESRAGTSSGLSCWPIAATGSCLLPESGDAMTWHVRDHGFEMSLSARVPSLIEAHLRPWLSDWLESHDVRPGDVRSWAIHPGGPRVISTVATALGLGPDAQAASLGVLNDHGNMSSPTILFILNRLRRAEAPLPCVALAFGPGLVIEAALFA
jgi:predicted naringenin-chalcone synthase